MIPNLTICVFQSFKETSFEGRIRFRGLLNHARYKNRHSTTQGYQVL